jgi:hypothetical protein
MTCYVPMAAPDCARRLSTLSEDPSRSAMRWANKSAVVIEVERANGPRNRLCAPSMASSANAFRVPRMENTVRLLPRRLSLARDKDSCSRCVGAKKPFKCYPIGYFHIDIAE